MPGGFDERTILPEDERPGSGGTSSFGLPTTPPTGSDPLPATAAELSSLVGQRVGSFTILARLAEGGMGVVYRARQDRPEREVALKLIRPGVATPSLLRR